MYLTSSIFQVFPSKQVPDIWRRMQNTECVLCLLSAAETLLLWPRSAEARSSHVLLPHFFFQFPNAPKRPPIQFPLLSFHGSAIFLITHWFILEQNTCLQSCPLNVTSKQLQIFSQRNIGLFAIIMCCVAQFVAQTWKSGSSSMNEVELLCSQVVLLLPLLLWSLSVVVLKVTFIIPHDP